MKLIDRYVGKEIFLTASMAIAVLSLVLVLGNVFKQLLNLLVNHDVPFDYILAFIAYIIPFSLTFTIPWGFLTAVLLVFGKMSAENELTALRSTGISMVRICWALFVLALVCCAICLWINVSVAPRAQQKMKLALFNIATSNPIAMFGSDQVIDEFPNTKIYVGQKEGQELRNLIMYQTSESGDPLSVVFARSGKLEADLANQRIMLHLRDARYEERDSQRPNDLAAIHQGITMADVPLPISLTELYEKNKKRRGLNQETLSELLEQKDLANASAAKTEINKRFSFSLASLAFAIIGVPLAITAHRRETSAGFLFSIIVAFVYFLFIIMADTVRLKPALHPELLIWLPNVIFLALGGVLFYRLAKK